MENKTLNIVTKVLVCICISFFTISCFYEQYAYGEEGNKESGKIAIVIDDFGYEGEGTNDMLDLKIPITAAIIPFTEHSSYEAKLAAAKGKEVIIHMPMEPDKGKASWLGKKPLMTGLSNEEVDKRVREAIEEIPEAKGMNNHMGSKVMRDDKILMPVFKVLKEKQMFFLDSKTTMNSKGEVLCKELGVPYYGRDVFLDHVHSQQNVENELEKAADIAKEKGYAIVIGHVGGQGGKITVNGIKNKIHKLESQGIEFVFLSQLKSE